MNDSNSSDLTTGDPKPSVAAHTPGPWAHSMDGTLPIYIATKDGRWKHVPGTLIAEVGAKLTVGTGDFQEDLANARLIIAAPDMLAFCREVANTFADAKYPGSQESRLRNAALALIAKATRSAPGSPVARDQSNGQSLSKEA